MNALLTTLSIAQSRAFRASGYWADDTIYMLAAQHATRRPNAFAIRDRWRRSTYAELVSAADRLASSLRAKGLRPGQRVAVFLPSRLETAIAVLACSRNGYVCCPSLHRDHTIGDVVGLLARMRAAAVIAETGYGADASRHDLFEASYRIESMSGRYRLAPVSQGSAGQLLWPAEEMADENEPDRDPDSIVYLAFTSGTTGEPKGVMHSDNTLLANARALSSDWSLFENSVIYSLSPLSHNLGVGALVMTLIRGGEFVIHDLPRGQSLMDRIVETDATFLVGVPTHAIDLLTELRARKSTTLGRVKGFRISGASVPPSVAAGLIEHGVTPQSGYGMTEAGSHHYTLPTDDRDLICETSGRACSGYEVRIFSKENPDVQAALGEIGQIGGRGASLMLGYFDDQETTECSFNASGWFLTGDMGRIDEAGYLCVTGRKKDIIIRGGHNIYPAKIESLALRHPAIERAAAVPVADERLGEKVCMVVSLRAGTSIDIDGLLDHLDECGLSKFDMPEYFLQIDQMPLTTSGKILKRDLVTAIQDGRVQPRAVRFRPKAETET
jgi:acyl-CoA synthetase (AMP-forming)/AMP-acid ligase II